MRTAIWLYLFMFVAFFDLHAQYPILSPFALSLGAAPSFIGLIMGVYSITHLPGNLIAGYGVDKYGSKIFIVFSLIVAGIILLFQSNVKDPWHLLYIRSISGFVLAFLSPACLSLLARIAKDRIHQSKLMAGNGLIHTLASVVSPAAGAVLVAKIGFTTAFSVLGWILIITGILAIFGVKEKQLLTQTESKSPILDHHGHGMLGDESDLPGSVTIPWLFFLIPMALSCSQGILFFELPLMQSARDSILTSGVFFTLVSLGALLSISFWFLNKIPPFIRTVCGSISLAIVFFGLAIQWPIPLTASLFLIGMAKGIIYPALAALLAGITSSNRYGRVFSLLSISYSVGAFIGPMMAGQLRDHISSYFIAFFILMLALSLLPLRTFKTPITT
ncbi:MULTISPECIES: MFS transporter [unclassified Paenibacillus]|uniref:MFS transporter n=1 Tax=unclassified Paenibacillus TaxID=185978 RepID=UPI002782244D|nr:MULTISPECIES: MFS transporter [unclassified Paenibacillus]MDQ0901703.1 MFS family permease [Paenibacillus sp. V4I7]MDQ0919795.1 MFS family permease [Paenibacillus sp. V4I5]